MNSGFRLKFIITNRIVADIEDSLRFIERNTRTAYRIEMLQRENITEYPVKALREAIPTRSEKPCGLCLLEIYPLDDCRGSSRDNTHLDIQFSLVLPWSFIEIFYLHCQIQRSDPFLFHENPIGFFLVAIQVSEHF